MSFAIRRATRADVEGVVALERATLYAPRWPESEYAGMVEGEAAAGELRRCLLVAVEGGELCGFAVAKVFGAEAEIESVAVRVEARRRGIGRALCAALVEWCGSAGAKAVELEVRVGSEGAIALYEGLGFVVAGRRRGYYREPAEDALRMRCCVRDGAPGQSHLGILQSKEA